MVGLICIQDMILEEKDMKPGRPSWMVPASWEVGKIYGFTELDSTWLLKNYPDNFAPEDYGLGEK